MRRDPEIRRPRKAAPTTYNSATMTADPDLHFTMAPGAVYHLDATLQYQATTAADPGIATEFTVPAGTKMTLATISAMVHGQTPNLGSIDELTGAFEMHTLLQSTRISAIFSGTVVTSATAGTFALNFAENTSGDPVEVLQLSSMTALRIA